MNLIKDFLVDYKNLMKENVSCNCVESDFLEDQAGYLSYEIENKVVLILEKYDIGSWIDQQGKKHYYVADCEDICKKIKKQIKGLK